MEGDGAVGGRVGQREATQEYERAWGLVEARVDALALAGRADEDSLDEARFAFEEGYRAGYIKGLADHYPELEASVRAEKFYRKCVNELGQALAEAEQRNKVLKLAAYENRINLSSPGHDSLPSTPQDLLIHSDRDPLTPALGSSQRSFSASGRAESLGRLTDPGLAGPGVRPAMQRMSLGEPAGRTEPRPARGNFPTRLQRGIRRTPTAFSGHHAERLSEAQAQRGEPGTSSGMHYSDISSDSEDMEEQQRISRRTRRSAAQQGVVSGTPSSGSRRQMSVSRLMQMIDSGPSEDPDKHLADLQQATRELHIQDQMHSKRVDNVLKRMILAMDAQEGDSRLSRPYASPRYASPRWGKQS